MITQDKQLQTVGSTTVTNVTLYGLSTDTPKPTNVGNGSCFVEMDTMTVYFFDADSGTWLGGEE